MGIDYQYIHIILLLAHEFWFSLQPDLHTRIIIYLQILNCVQIFFFLDLFLTWLRIFEMSPDARLKVDLVTLAELQAQMSNGISSVQCTGLVVLQAFCYRSYSCILLIKAKCKCLVIIRYVFVNSPDGIFFFTFVYLRTTTECWWNAVADASNLRLH